MSRHMVHGEPRVSTQLAHRQRIWTHYEAELQKHSLKVFGANLTSHDFFLRIMGRYRRSLDKESLTVPRWENEWCVSGW